MIGHVPDPTGDTGRLHQAQTSVFSVYRSLPATSNLDWLCLAAAPEKISCGLDKAGIKSEAG